MCSAGTDSRDSEDHQGHHCTQPPLQVSSHTYLVSQLSVTVYYLYISFLFWILYSLYLTYMAAFKLVKQFRYVWQLLAIIFDIMFCILVLLESSLISLSIEGLDLYIFMHHLHFILSLTNLPPYHWSWGRTCAYRCKVFWLWVSLFWSHDMMMDGKNMNCAYLKYRTGH